MVASIIILAVGSILGSGILFRHQRYVTLLAGAGALFELWWLTLTLAHRVLAPEIAGSIIFLLGSLLFLGMWWPKRRQWQLPYWSATPLWRDAAVVAVMAPVMASAVLIQHHNGFIGDTWVAHGFYNGDTTTLATLVQRSLTTPGLVHENPFAANGPLEYPTLLHAGLAEWLTIAGLSKGWLRLLPELAYGQLLITIPLFFLFRDAVKDLPGWRKGYRWGWRGLALEAAMVGYVLGVSWESYVYPQGHFFTSALFIFGAALLTHVWPVMGKWQYLWSGFAALTTTMLLLSNAVTGIAAVVLWSTFGLLRAVDTTRGTTERRGYAVSIILLALLFLFQTPGEGGLHVVPHFSYTAAPNMLLLALPLVLLFGAVLQQLRQQSFIGVSTVALAAMSLIIFLFSGRAIIVDNAARFMYHALLIGWPLGVDGFVRLARVLVARIQQPPGWLLRVSGIGAAVVAVALALFPVVTSLMSVHDHLLFKDTHTSSTEVQQAMEWINLNTDPATVFLASPNEPWEIPLFTGRSLLRANYWLSPEDELAESVNKAFAGDIDAQRDVIAAADYVLLKSTEADSWNLPPESLVYDVSGIRIYDVGG